MVTEQVISPLSDGVRVVTVMTCLFSISAKQPIVPFQLNLVLAGVVGWTTHNK